MRRSQCVRVSLLVNVITFVVMDLGLEPQVCKFNFRKAGALLAGICGKEFALEGSARIVSRFLMTNSNFFDGLKTKVPKGKMFPDKLCLFIYLFYL